jgi:hypothetical protein
VTVTPSRYVPPLTLTMSPARALSTADWIVLYRQPCLHTVSVWNGPFGAPWSPFGVEGGGYWPAIAAEGTASAATRARPAMRAWDIK